MFAQKLMIFISLLIRNQKSPTLMYLTQNLYNLFTSSNQHQVTTRIRKTPYFEHPIKECEKSIKNELLASLFTKPANNQKCRIKFSLPLMEGGLEVLKGGDRFKEYAPKVQLPSFLSKSLLQS